MSLRRKSATSQMITFLNENVQSPMKITIQSKAGETAFDCGENEIILHSGLRSGLTLPYECASGTCGTCRARVKLGTVEVQWREAPGYLHLKPNKGDILMCQSRPRSDCFLQVPSEVKIFEKFRPQVRQGTIENLRRLTKDLAHFMVRLSSPISFEAGQFVLVETDGLSGGRAYSMVNFASETDRIDLLLKRKPHGGFSEWLFAQERVGANLRIFGPLGRAAFRPEEERDIVCIGGGSGIAGMMSILERAAQVDYFLRHRGEMFFGFRTLDDCVYLSQLARYSALGHGNLDITIVLSDEPAQTRVHVQFPMLKLASGLVHDVAVRCSGLVQDSCLTFVAGPPIMVDCAIRALIVAGVPTGSIRYDKFS